MFRTTFTPTVSLRFRRTAALAAVVALAFASSARGQCPTSIIGSVDTPGSAKYSANGNLIFR